MLGDVLTFLGPPVYVFDDEESSTYRMLQVPPLLQSGTAVRDLMNGCFLYIQLTEDYEKLNPLRQVPTLVIDGNTLTQSVSFEKKNFNFYYLLSIS